MLALFPSRWCQYTDRVGCFNSELEFLFQEVLNDETPEPGAGRLWLGSRYAIM